MKRASYANQYRAKWQSVLPLLSAVCLCGTLLHHAVANDVVVVHLSSGRSFTAHVDERTDASALWLRFEQTGMHILRRIEWDRVVSATVDGQPVTRELLVAERDEGAAERGEGGVERGQGGTEWNERVAKSAPKIVSVSIDAWLANEDGDIESDALHLTLAATDAAGGTQPVRGTMDARLLAPLSRRFHEAPHERGASLEVIGNWTKVVTPADFRDGTAELRLPFLQRHPEFDERLGAHALLHIRIAIPGQGVFDRTLNDVRIRPYSAIRDGLQMRSGTRFYQGGGW